MKKLKKLRIPGVHGIKALLPFLEYVEVSSLHTPDLKIVVLKEKPFLLIRETHNFCKAYGCSLVDLDYPMDSEDAVEDFDYEIENIIQI
jgi:hypothetical protein